MLEIWLVGGSQVPSWQTVAIEPFQQVGGGQNWPPPQTSNLTKWHTRQSHLPVRQAVIYDTCGARETVVKYTVYMVLTQGLGCKTIVDGVRFVKICPYNLITGPWGVWSGFGVIIHQMPTSHHSDSWSSRESKRGHGNVAHILRSSTYFGHLYVLCALVQSPLETTPMSKVARFWQNCISLWAGNSAIVSWE